MRLQTLEPWINKWARLEMYVGAGSQGAGDAWYQTLIDLELLKLEGSNYCGGAADLWKYFDQIARPLVYSLAKAAGMPPEILVAYKRFQENLLVHNSLASTIGQPYTWEFSIPQGCPLSMMIVALMMRPWIMLMKEMNVDPKVLADDAMIIAKGIRMIKRLARLPPRHGSESGPN